MMLKMKNVRSSTALKLFIGTGMLAIALNANAGMAENLKKRCGKRFDGVNAISISGLEHSLEMRKKMSSYPGKRAEMNELKCRLKYLRKNK